MSTEGPREHAEREALEPDPSVESPQEVDMSVERDVENAVAPGRDFAAENEAGSEAGSGAQADADSGSELASEAGPEDDAGTAPGAAGETQGETQGEAGGEAGGESVSDVGAGSEGETADSDLPPLPTVLEAILLVTDVPVPAVTLAQVVERPTGEVEAVLNELAQGYDEQGRGFELRQVAGGWRLYTRAECAPFVERFVLDGQQARLTQAALETLAVIAYRQPVTRQRVSAVRGVNVDGVVRTLVARGLITEAGTDEDTGATRYQTTSYFLERLGLQSLDDLPSLAPLLPELEDVTDDSVSS